MISCRILPPALLPALALALGATASALADVRVHTPGADIRAPSGPVDLKVDVDGKLAPKGNWVGRAVYSIDGKHLGQVAAVANDNFYVDMGGFLGIGESRVLLNRVDVGSVTDERIVVKMTEADAKNLPSTDAKRAPPASKP